MEPQSKICTQCSKELPIDKFYRDRTIFTTISYRSKCKQCCLVNNSNRKQHMVDTKINEKLCKTCNKSKKVSNYYVSKRHIDGYFSECISCTEIKRSNKGKNPRFKRTPEYMKDYLKERKKDPNYRMKYALRSNLTSHVERIQGGTKSERTMKYVGCSLDFLKNWFEFLFDDLTSWDNYGTYWHIDHIKPCSSFNLSKQEDIFKCYHWSNLRPLNKTENLSKGNLVDIALIETYELFADAFLGLTQYIAAP